MTQQCDPSDLKGQCVPQPRWAVYGIQAPVPLHLVLCSCDADDGGQPRGPTAPKETVIDHSVLHVSADTRLALPAQIISDRAELVLRILTCAARRACLKTRITHSQDCRRCTAPSGPVEHQKDSRASPLCAGGLSPWIAVVAVVPRATATAAGDPAEAPILRAALRRLTVI